MKLYESRKLKHTTVWDFGYGPGPYIVMFIKKWGHHQTLILVNELLDKKKVITKYIQQNK